MVPIHHHEKKPGSRRSDLLVSALAVAFLIVLVVLYFPAVVYADNAPFITYSLLDFLTVALPAALGLCLLALLVLALLPGRALRVLAPPLAFLAFGAWVMGAFVTPLTTDVGLIDGSHRELPARPGLAAIELATALALLAAFWRAFERLRRVATSALVIANILALGYVGVAVARDSAPAGQDAADAGFSADRFMRFSEKENILIVLMDEFQSDFLVALLEEDPTLAEALDGFTFFRDTAAVSPNTSLALPHMHYGTYVDLSLPLADIRNFSINNSFSVQAARLGAEVHLLNPLHPGPCPQGVICGTSQSALQLSESTMLNELLLLVDIALLRISPYILNSPIYDGGRWRASRYAPSSLDVSVDAAGIWSYNVIWDNRVLNTLGRQLYVDGVRPTLKFLHLFNTHRPYIFDRECNVREARNQSWSAALNSARCAMKEFVYVLSKLDEAGIYDSTTIVLVADHGAGFLIWPIEGGHVISVDEERNVTMFHEKLDLRLPFGRAHPVFLVKPPGARGRVAVDTERAASLVDLPATVCNFTNLCSHRGDGVSAFEAPEGASRQRRYYDYLNEEVEGGSMEEFVEMYIIEAPMWRAGLDWTTADTMRFQESVLAPEGYSGVESWGRWTDGPEARIPLRFDEVPGGDLELVAEVQPFIRNDHPRQRVQVRINGKPVGEWAFVYPDDASPQERRSPLPRRLVADDGTALVTFHFPDATVSPADLGESEDGRLLGLGFRTLRLEPAGERIN